MKLLQKSCDSSILWHDIWSVYCHLWTLRVVSFWKTLLPDIARSFLRKKPWQISDITVQSSLIFLPAGSSSSQRSLAAAPLARADPRRCSPRPMDSSPWFPPPTGCSRSATPCCAPLPCPRFDYSGDGLVLRFELSIGRGREGCTSAAAPRPAAGRRPRRRVGQGLEYFYSAPSCCPGGGHMVPHRWDLRRRRPPAHHMRFLPRRLAHHSRRYPSSVATHASAVMSDLVQKRCSFPWNSGQQFGSETLLC